MDGQRRAPAVPRAKKGVSNWHRGGLNAGEPVNVSNGNVWLAQTN
jgi:hypothetical protein